MALISMGALAADIRNKVGSNVFTRTKSGNTVRIRIVPRNPRSTAQVTARANMTAAAKAYKALSSANVADWEAYALGITHHQKVSGQAFHPSAISAFTALASKFLQITPGGTIPTSPPATPYVPDTVTVTAAGGSGQVTFTGSADNAAGSKTEVLLQALASPNRTPSANGYRNEGFSAVPNGTPVVVSGLAAGDYVPAYRMVKTATGEVGPLHTLATVTVS